MTKLIILHGLGQTKEDWENVTTCIDADSQIISLFTAIDYQSDVTIETIYSTISKQLDDITEPYYLCGLSLGGMLALMYTCRSTHPHLKGIIIAGAIYKPIPKMMVVFQTLLFMIFPQKKFDTIGLSKKQMIQLTSSINIDLTESLKRINLPSLVVCGEKDTVNIKSTKQIHSLISTSDLYIVPNGAHELNKNTYLELSQVINSFIDKQEST